ncbi:hypothetical protein OESDEN_16335 [Oesophagostomum dentatum]|uniref:Uncharacterized protein n=1 Tax=Oesophagostomum dentatum TaxID=61180 RepID=A0A0B1SKA9_OESDE|nr:hypothetical protein OESDEN_16335 [Oesophagostomum dentatum]
MLELSLAPKDRLMYLLQYSRPTGTNKKMRSFVVNKNTYQDKSPEEIAAAREEKSKKIIEERKTLLKRRLKDIEIREGLRPCSGRLPSAYLGVKEN